MKQNRLSVILVLLVVLATAFIFSNSLKNGEESVADSDAIIALIEPLIEKIFGEEHQIDLNYIVRKSAHLAEFFLLGALTSCLILDLKRRHGKHLRGYEFFYVLAVAVADEYIQSFTGRTSMVADILIDFLGAILGFGTVFLIFAWRRRKKK